MGDMPERIWIDPLSDERRYATNMLASGGYMGEPYVPEDALARARREAWEAGRDAAAGACSAYVCPGSLWGEHEDGQAFAMERAEKAIRALTPPEEPPHDGE